MRLWLGNSEMDVDVVIACLRATVEAADRRLAQFTDKFAIDPLYAFEWGMNAMEYAGKRDVAIILLARLEKNRDMPTLIEWVREKVNGMAMYPVRSTSPMHCLAHQSELAAWATWLEDGQL